MTVALVDDYTLGRVLRGDLPHELDPEETIYTTGCWYLRLCQAVLGRHQVVGQLSRPFRDLPDELRDRALGLVVELPVTIGLISLRDLAPCIPRLRHDHLLNLLSIEALAAATTLDATVVLSTASPMLEAALAAEGQPVRLIGDS